MPRKRRPINRNDLYLLIEAQVMSRVTTRQTFTAYAITLALRATNPGLAIMHVEVCERVHDLMANLSFLQHPYQLEWRNYNGNPARTYLPYDLINTDLGEDGQRSAAVIDWDS